MSASGNLFALQAAIANAKDAHSEADHPELHQAFNTVVTALSGGNSPRGVGRPAGPSNPVQDGGHRQYDTSPRAQVPDAYSGNGGARRGRGPTVTNKKSPAYTPVRKFA